MSNETAALERRAIEYAKSGDFGTAALETNRELARLAPSNPGAWTRLARCCLEQKQFDDASTALGRALELNPSNTIAKSLQQEVARRRAATPVHSEAASGFTPQDFYTLGLLAPTDAARTLGPKMESLLLSLNEQRTSARILDARHRAGQSGGKLYRRNSYYAGSHGHVYAFHHGGRWEPQFHLTWLAANPWGQSTLGIGLGFNMSATARDAEEGGGQSQALAFFDAFQKQLAGTWRGHLVEWMGKTGGFLQYGERPPAFDLMPKQAVDWIVNCRNPGGIGWVFVGRWLFVDRADDQRTLSESRKLVAAVEDTFAALFPLWNSVYSG